MKARDRWAGVVAAATVLALVLSGCFLVRPRPAPSTHAPDTTGVSEDLLDFYDQPIAWSSCEDDAFDCGTVRAPLDWADPTAGDIELAIIRSRAEGGEPVGSLLVNPGGPGVSGYDFVRDYGTASVSAPVRDAYDVIGFDPRGVGRSTPVDCLDGAELDAYLYDIPPGDRGSDEWNAFQEEQNARFVDACVANDAELLPFLSTENAARDLDLLRAVLGDETLNYLGFSWGTALGAAYAGLYPERVGRLVLDGAMDPSLSGTDIGGQQAAGFEASLRAFLADCLTLEDCPFGGSVDDAVADLAAMLARADERPLQDVDGRMLGADALLTAVTAALYSESSWSYLRAALAAVADGDPSIAFLLADSYNSRFDGVYADNTTAAFTAYNCMDYPYETEAESDASVERLRQEAPLIAEYWLGADVCATWPAEPTGVREPIHAEGAAPILVIGTTGDPATPYAWAVSLAEQLSSGILVTRVGEGHTGYNEGNACVDGAIEAYLVDGVVPASDIRCD